jgi:muramidase (phage lysozyme)
MATIGAPYAGGQNVVRFLDLIAFSEGTSTSIYTKDDGYDVLVSGVPGSASPHVFSSFADHPFIHLPAVLWATKPHNMYSTAAGRYQQMLHDWGYYKNLLKLADFSPLSQDEVALQHIRESKALVPLQQGNIEHAINLCSNIWASFPGNNYGQAGGKHLQVLIDWYNAH